MIVHLVLIRERDDLTEDERAELERATARLETIESVLEMSWGRNFSERARGYTYGAVIHFQDRDGLQAYQVHPEHVRAVEVYKRLAPDRLVLDYETGSSEISTD